MTTAGPDAGTPAPPPVGGPGLFRFAGAELDERSRELRVGGHPVPVEAKPFDVLAQLLRHPGETLTKDELLDLVWPGRVVTEGVLAKCVMKLRALLGDDDQLMIRTVHGYGYRIGVPVERREAGEARAFTPRAGESVPHRPNWHLVRALGEGGSALVWLAEHGKTREPRVFKYARDAATLGALKREVTIYRVLRDALGDAAPVVRIHDWNLDEPPYHTESAYIAGGNLGDWLLAHPGASRAQRIDLIAQCAEAVAQAHAVGVLHKDLKPANVLVDARDADRPRVVLCDFGVGALLDPERLRALGITRLGFTRGAVEDGDTSGTPLYLAPEVMTGRAPTVASDVYALGVMLYQALIGDPQRPLAPGWQRDLDDELLREDIEAAADGDPQRRLADAGELARRLRTLDARRAARTSQEQAAATAVRLQLQLERIRARRGWLLALLGVLVLAVASVSALYLRAQRSAESVHAVNEFLNADLLALTDPNLSQDADLKATALLDRAAAKVAQRFAQQPDVELEIRTTLGRGYRGLGAFTQAAEQFERAALLAQRHLAPDDMRAIELKFWRADLELARSHAAAAGEAFAQVQGLASEHLGADSRLALEAAVKLQAARFEAGEQAAAAEAMQALLPRIDRALGVHDPLAVFALNRLAIMLNSLERIDDAERVRLQHLDRARAAYGPAHSATLTGQLNHAAQLRKAGRLDEALREADAAEAGLRKVFGFPSMAALHAMNVRSRILMDLERLDEAADLAEETLRGRLALLGPEHDDTAFSYVALGAMRAKQKRFGEAVDAFRAALAIREKLLGPDHIDTLTNRTLLADALREHGELEAALIEAERAAERARATLAMDRPERANALFRLGQVHVAHGEIEAARTVLRDAVQGFSAAYGPDHARTRAAAEALQALD